MILPIVFCFLAAFAPYFALAALLMAFLIFMAGFIRSLARNASAQQRKGLANE
jgi:hypothetical protein